MVQGVLGMRNVMSFIEDNHIHIKVYQSESQPRFASDSWNQLFGVYGAGFDSQESRSC